MDLLTSAQQTLRHYLIARGATSQMVGVRGGSLHHYVVHGKGEGPPVLLVHGLAGSANGYYRLLFALARRFRTVYAVDLPGHGFSPPPSSGAVDAQLLLDALAAYAADIVRAPSLVVGNSLGGAISVRFAKSQPQLVRALALICPAGAQMSAATFEEVQRSMMVTTTKEAMALTRKLFHGFPLAWILLSSELKKMYGTEVVRGVFGGLTPEDHLTPAELGALQMPVMVLWGKSDGLLPSEGMDYFRAHLPPEATVERVEGFGHVPQVERPKEVVRRLIQFADANNL